MCGDCAGSPRLIPARTRAIAALMTAEQSVHEYALDPGILGLAVAAGGNAGLLATLTLGVGEVMAGDYLQQTARAGTVAVFKAASVSFATPPGQTPGLLGNALTKQGLARLAPFTRAARSVTATAAGVDAGLVPDGAAPIPLLIASTVPEPSVFDQGFGEAPPPQFWGAGEAPPPQFWGADLWNGAG